MAEKKHFERLLSGAIASAAMAGGAHAEPRVETFHEDHVLGASLDIAMTGPAKAAERALEATRAEIARLDPILSGWRVDSELAALNQSTTFRASPDLFQVVSDAEYVRRVTGGAFSARLGAATALLRHGDLSPEHLTYAAGKADRARVTLDRENFIINHGDTAFDLDAIAKGYVIDRALRAARAAAPDLRGVLIDIGGDIATWGAPPGQDGWTIGVADPGRLEDNARPAHIAVLRNQAIATSGAGMRDIAFAGERTSHLLSPHTGLPLRAPLQASVIAPTAAQADALATAMAVMAPEDALTLADDLPGVAVLLAKSNGAALQSGRWTMFGGANAIACQAPVEPTGAPWPKDFRVEATFQIPEIKTGKYEKPYISAWISDSERKLVRILLVIGEKARFRESNYIWWRRFERMDAEAIQAISKPTRPPGTYTLTWDGLNDAGKPVGQGKYTLNIEIAREHGSHSFQAIPLDLGATPFETSSPAQEEIGVTRAGFKRK